LTPSYDEISFSKQKALFFFPLQAFFDKDYITKHPGDAEKITQLKELMQEQVPVFRSKRTFLQCLDSSAVSLNESDPTDSFRNKEFWYRRYKVHTNKKEGRWPRCF